MSEANSGLPETTEQALELSKERLSTQESAGSGREQSGEAQAAANSGETKGDAQSSAEADFSFLADPNLRAAFEQANLSGEVAQAMKAWVADYTRKSQAISEYESKAAAWEALEEIPGARKTIAELLSQDDDDAYEPVEEEPVDLTTADNETIWNAIREEASKLARQAAEDTLQERLIEPVTNRQSVINSAKSLWPKWQDKVDEAGFRQAWEEAVNHYGEDSFNPQNTPYLFEPFLKSAAARQELEVIKGNRTREVDFVKRATSPAGSSGSASRSSREDSAITKMDKRSVRSMTRKQILERFGWSESDLNRSASGG